MLKDSSFVSLKKQMNILDLVSTFYKLKWS
jgi:hypothetical protein